MSSPTAPYPETDLGARSRLRRIGPWVVLGLILAVGLWVRCHLAAMMGYVPDLKWFYYWADAAHRGNVGSPYDLPGRMACDYPPGYILLLSRIPWFYEQFTGRSFREIPEGKTNAIDEVDRAFALLMAQDGLLKARGLLRHYEKSDPALFKATVEGHRTPLLGRLIGLGLFSQDELRQIGTPDPQKYEQVRPQVVARVQTVLEGRVRDEVPARMRRLAVWIKLPALLFDLAGAAVLFALLRHRRGAAGALVVAAIYTFLPAVIYDSACWGQVDAVHSLLMLLCLACLVAWQPFWMGLVFTAAMLTKFQSIVILPVLLAGTVRRWREAWAGQGGESDRRKAKGSGANQVLRSAAWIVVGGLVAAAVILMPFAVTGSAGKVLDTYGQAVTRFHWVSVCAFNPWWMLNPKPDLTRWYYQFIPQDQVPVLGPVTPKHIGLLALAVFSLGVMWLIYRRGCSYEPVAAAGAAMVMGFFVLPTEIHERYAFPVMILAAWLVGAGWRHLPVLLLLSMAQFYNFTCVQPVEDPRFQWLMPFANVLVGHGKATWALVLIHVACLVYFVVVLWRIRLAPIAGKTPERSAPRSSATERDGRRRRR